MLRQQFRFEQEVFSEYPVDTLIHEKWAGWQGLCGPSRDGVDTEGFIQRRIPESGFRAIHLRSSFCFGPASPHQAGSY